MRIHDVMRYYHPFPEAIPLSEAGYSRVTHPSATKNIKQAQCSPFDLHVLSVPPAFVLSQDQTLYLSCIYRRFASLYRSWQLRFARNYLCDFSVFSDFLKFQSLGISRAFLLVVHCSIFKILSKQLSCCNFYIISHSEVFVK